MKAAQLGSRDTSIPRARALAGVREARRQGMEGSMRLVTQRWTSGSVSVSSRTATGSVRSACMALRAKQ